MKWLWSLALIVGVLSISACEDDPSPTIPEKDRKVEVVIGS
jgi:hypothetical protein